MSNVGVKGLLTPLQQSPIERRDTRSLFLDQMAALGMLSRGYGALARDLCSSAAVPTDQTGGEETQLYG